MAWAEIVSKPTPWMRDALCAIHPNPDMWFPTDSSSNTRTNAIIAKSICGDCTVNPQCLHMALRDDTLDGIWAGTTPHQRTKLRKARP